VHDQRRSGEHLLTILHCPSLTRTQRIGVYTMECVGYDETFQRQVAEKWANWVAAPSAKKRKAQDQSAAPNGKKRKISNDKKGKGKVQAHIEEEEELAESESEGEDSEVEDEEDSGDIGYKSYVPSGTRSRPRT
jgi:hypothetical protein